MLYYLGPNLHELLRPKQRRLGQPAHSRLAHRNPQGLFELYTRVQKLRERRSKRSVMIAPLREVRVIVVNGLGPLKRSSLRETACSSFSCTYAIVRFVLSFPFSRISSSLKLVLDDQKLQKFGISYVSKINLKELLSCRKLNAAGLSTF
jgi:hypothetical protein